MKFKSKIDFFYIIMTIIFLGVIIIPLFFLEINWIFWVYLPISILICAFIVSLVFFTNCTLNKDFLKIRSGFLTLELKYNLIINIKTCKNFQLSFATALNKVEISFGANRNSKWNKFYVSPKNEQQFINELTKRCIDTASK